MLPRGARLSREFGRIRSRGVYSKGRLSRALTVNPTTQPSREHFSRRASLSIQPQPASNAIVHGPLVQHLLELVAALDRRMPQVMRAGEEDIARDAATLRQRALRRIDELCADVELGG